MSEHEEAIKAIENKIEDRVKQYEGQVRESGEAVKSVRDQLRSITEEYESRIKELEQQTGSGYNGGASHSKSVGEQFTESENYKNFDGRAFNFETKATVTQTDRGGVSDGVHTVDRASGVFGSAFSPLTLLDLIPQGQTSQGSFEYTREKAFTNNAKETAEAAAAPESSIEFETVTDSVRKIATYIRVSEEIMNDAPAVATFIDNRLSNSVRNKMQKQIVAGTGNAPQLAGFASSGRHMAYQAVAKDTQLDSINKAKAKVIDADYTPNVLIVSPSDWSAIELIKDSNKNFVGSAGVVNYINNGLIPTVWGLPVVTTSAMPSGKFAVADTTVMQLLNNGGLYMTYNAQDGNNAVHGQITIVAGQRSVFSVFAQGGIVYGDLLATTSG